MLCLGTACSGAPKDTAEDTAVPTSSTDTGPGVYTPCVDPITAPVQVAQELSGTSPRTAVKISMQYNLDLACLVSCEEGDACGEASCTPAEGVELTYLQIVTALCKTAQAEERFWETDATLRFPSGALREPVLHMERFETDDTGADGGSYGVWTSSVSWVGELSPGLPSDGTATETEEPFGDDCCWGVDRTYDIDGCVTRYVDDAPPSHEVEYVERAGQQVVYWEPDAWLDGDCLAEVEPYTSVEVGPCVNPDDPPPID